MFQNDSWLQKSWYPAEVSVHVFSCNLQHFQSSKKVVIILWNVFRFGTVLWLTGLYSRRRSLRSWANPFSFRKLVTIQIRWLSENMITCKILSKLWMNLWISLSYIADYLTRSSNWPVWFVITALQKLDIFKIDGVISVSKMSLKKNTL